MEKAVHGRPVSGEDEALSCSKKPRLEASPSSEDIQKYSIFTDSEYKLPLYLCGFADSVFNSKKKTCYGNVNVVKTMKSLNVNGTTYLATFEASLPNKRNNAKTFQTNIFMSPLAATTKVEVKFVRMKPSGFDYNGEEESEEKVSESEGSSEDEEDSEEEPSDESDEEESEKELSDESDEEDNEEKLSTSDEKGNNRKLPDRKTVGGKGPRVPLVSCCVPRKYYDPPEWNLSTASLNQLVYLSQLALCIYNMKEVTYYDNVKVLKAMESGCGRSNYTITFEASLSDGNVITFETKIWMHYPFPCHKIEIMYVKPILNSDAITK